MADWFETRFRDDLDLGAPAPALAERVRALVVEEWQAIEALPSVAGADTDPEGDVIMLETEDRETTGPSTPSAKRRSPGRWLLAAAAAAVIAILATMLSAGDGEKQENDTVNSTTTVPDPGVAPGSVGASATIPEGAEGIAIRAIGDATGVWTHTPGKVVRFDVDTLDLVAEIPVTVSGDIGGMLLLEGGSVFVGLEQGIVEIDTETNEVVRTYDLPNAGARTGSSMAVDSTGLIASAEGGDRLVRFDRATGEIVAERAFESPKGVASLIAVDGATYAGVYPATLHKLDPTTLETVATAEVSAISITDIDVDGGLVVTLGFRGANGTLGVIDVLDRNSLELQRPDPIEIAGSWPQNFEVVDGQAYVGAKFTNVIHSYDLATGELSGDIEVAKTSESVDSGGGSILWSVAWETRELQRIDLD